MQSTALKITIQAFIFHGFVFHQSQTLPSVSLKRLNSKEQHIESNHFVLFLSIYGFFRIGIVHLLSIASFFIYTNKYLFLPTIFIPANVFFVQVVVVCL